MKKTCLLLTMIVFSLAWGQEFTVCEQALKRAEDWAVPGKDGWLFSDVDLSVPVALGSATTNLQRLAEVLRRQGVTLIAVVNPRRGMVESGNFDLSEPKQASYDATAAQQIYRDFLNTLESIGIIAPDMLSVAMSATEGETYFFKRDVHWTPEGARLAARAVAEIIRTLPEYETLAKVPFVSSADTTFPVLGGWSKIVRGACKTVPPEEMMAVYDTSRQDEVGLLDEVQPPDVVLVGTSYSKLGRVDEPDFNFEGFLKEALSLDVLNMAVPAGGPFTSMLYYLTSQEYVKHKPKFLIWEFQMPVSSSLESATLYRQLIPSVYGACTPEESVVQQSSEVSGSSSVILSSDREDVQGSDYFLYLELSDPTLVEFAMTLRHGGGQEENVKIERSTRVENSGKFFLELSNTIPSSLLEVSLQLPEARPITSEARICLSN